MTVVEFETEEFCDLVGTKLSPEEVEAKVSMMGAAPEGLQGTRQRFDINPNRADWLSIEGLVRSFRGVLGLETGLPSYPVIPGSVRFVVDESVKGVRPFGIGAIVRDVDLTERSLKSLIELQENLHLTHGRRRRKVAIGIHDADAVTPPFAYKAVPPESVRFTPLGLAGTMDLGEILARHEKGREFGHLVADKPRFPVITDAKGVVLSFPPIINGITTQLTPSTRNLFVDVTGTDEEAVEVGLNVMCTALADRGARIESVEVVAAEGSRRTPDLEPRRYTLDVLAANELAGLSLPGAAMAECLEKMRHEAEPDGGVIRVRTPRFRSDIMNAVDLVEDVAIGFGYERVPMTLPRLQTSGSATRTSEFSDGLRTVLVGYGYQEVMSLTVAPPEEPYESPSRTTIINPVTVENSRIRSSLLPSLLALFALNKHHDLPQRIFEIGEVVRAVKNVRLVAGASLHARASFTEGKSLVQGLMRDVGKPFEIEPAEDPNFIDGRCASVRIAGAVAGIFGEMHPRVVAGYGLGHPIVAFELAVPALL